MAYGGFPERWDRDRFERLGNRQAPSRYEEDYRYQERDRPGHQDIAVQDRIQSSGPRGRYEEQDRYYEHDKYTPGGRRKRTDRELFGDQDPREIANLALTPYQGQNSGRSNYDMDQQRSPPPRPGMIRRQSSLTTFDRRPIPRYEREEYRVPVYTPAPAPYPPQDSWGGQEDYGRRYDEPEGYREVEIQRERSVHRSKPKSVKSSKAKSVTTRRSSSSSSSSERQSTHKGGASLHESFHESYHGGGNSFHEDYHKSVHGGTESVHTELTKKFKKGKTRMPKRLVRREAIMDLGYPFDEEDDFFVLRIALEKEQIDEVITISERYKSGGKYYAYSTGSPHSDDIADKTTTYKYEEKVDEAPYVPPTKHEEVYRTEWINPPTVVGSRHSRSHSHSGRSHHRSSSGSDTTRRAPSRHTSHANQNYEERKSVYETRSPPPPPAVPPPPQTYYEQRQTVVEEREGETLSPTHSHQSYHTRSPSHHHHHHDHGSLVLQEREYRSDRDIQTEISKLEAERRSLRLEREADEMRGSALTVRDRPAEEYQLVEYNHPHRAREVLPIYERERERERRDSSPSRNVTRVEKDRKGRMALVRSSN